MDRRDGVLKYSIAVLLQLLVCQLFLPLSADRDVEPLNVVRPNDRSMRTSAKARTIGGRVAAHTPARVGRETEGHPSLSGELDVLEQERSGKELYELVGNGQCRGLGEEEEEQLPQPIPMEENFQADEITEGKAPECEARCNGLPTCIGFTVYPDDQEEEPFWRCALVTTDTLNAAQGIIDSDGSREKLCWRRASKHVEAGESELHTNRGSMMNQGDIALGTVDHRHSSDVEETIRMPLGWQDKEELYEDIGPGQCQGLGERGSSEPIPIVRYCNAGEIDKDSPAPECEEACNLLKDCIGFTVYRDEAYHDEEEEESLYACALIQRGKTENADQGIESSDETEDKHCWSRVSKHVEAGVNELHTDQGSFEREDTIHHGTVGHRQSSEGEDLGSLEADLSNGLGVVTSREPHGSLGAPSVGSHSSEREAGLTTPVKKLTDHLSAERDENIIGQEEETRRQSSVHSEPLADQLEEEREIGARVQKAEGLELKRLEASEKNGRPQVGQMYEDGLEGLQRTSTAEREVEPSGKKHVWEKVDGDKFCQTFGKHMVELSQDSPTYVEANARDHHLFWWMIIGCPIVPQDSEARGSILVTVASSGEHAVMYLKPYEDLTRSFVDWDNAFTLELGVPMNTQDIYQMLNIKGQNLTDIPQLENKYCKLTAEFYKVPDLDEKQTMADRVMWRKDIIPILQCCPGPDACQDDEIKLRKRFT